MDHSEKLDKLGSALKVKPIVPVIELAEERLLREMQAKEEVKKTKKNASKKKEDELESKIDFMKYISDPVTKLDLVQARLDVAAKNAK
jgi:hypothetical protein